MLRRVAETVLVAVVAVAMRVLLPENYDDDTLTP